MTTLLIAKQNLKRFINKNEAYLMPLGKLVLSLFTLMVINAKLGFMDRLNNIAVVLVVALMCSFMPLNFIVLVGGLFILLHMYALSLECAVVALAVFLVMYLLYFRLTPKDTILVLLTPVCFMLNIPYAAPICAGLMGTPVSAVSVGCGVVVSYLVSYVSEGATSLSAIEAEDMASKFRFVIDGFLGNKDMLITIVAFAITIIVVYYVRRMEIDHAWTIAIVAGALSDVMILLIGDLVLDTNISVLGLILGTAVAVLIGKVAEFFVFNVDYSRTEKVQFEDDEYYYYVKAVPKITVAAPSRTVKKINSAKRKPTGGYQPRH